MLGAQPACQARSERCAAESDCARLAAGATCEASGYCSYPDHDCPHGRRYGARSPAPLREACVKVSVCGDGRWHAAEYCEDGNLDNDDGCTAGCVTCDDSIGEARAAAGDGACWSRHATPLPWARAQAVCAAQGGHLAALEASGSWPDLAVRLLADAPARYWIGLALAAQPRRLSWITGVEPSPALRYHAEEDPSPGPGRDCATLSLVERSGTQEPALGLEDCSNARPFLCVTTPWRVRRATSHAYRVAHGRFSWDEAEERCQQMAAHLATLTGEDEAAFVRPLLQVPVWIGAHDQQTEGRFAWVTGERFGYAAFGPNQPDNHGEQDCLAAEPDGRWYDRGCGARYPALCELD